MLKIIKKSFKIKPLKPKKPSFFKSTLSLLYQVKKTDPKKHPKTQKIAPPCPPVPGGDFERCSNGSQAHFSTSSMSTNSPEALRLSVCDFKGF